VGWADLKFVCFSRDELAAGMRRHTKDPIHDPLTLVRKRLRMRTRLQGVHGWVLDVAARGVGPGQPKPQPRGMNMRGSRSGPAAAALG
jgi:hypothetical protein